MNLFEVIELGETVEIRIGAIATKTKISGIADETQFSVDQPTYRMTPLQFEPGEAAQFSMYRANGLYSFRAAYLSKSHASNTVQVYNFRAVSEVEKNQRRYSYRLPVVLDATVTVKALSRREEDQVTQVRTVNLSAEGALLACPKSFVSGSDVVFDIQLHNKAMRLNMRLLRCERPLERGQPYLVAGKFTKLSKPDQAEISRYILWKQIQDRRLRAEGR